MRVHGQVKIQRRKNVPRESNYRKYTTILQEDFYHICGYCGKSELVTTKGFEPDHFVPDRIDHLRQTDYSNLVHSCFTCNRKKLGKWPTEDKTKPHNSIEGFVDPATDEFDQHIERDSQGHIVGKTPVGIYMCEKAFKFNIRPIKEIYKYMKILEVQLIIEQKIDCLLPEESKFYIELNIELKALHNYLFSNNE